MQHRPSAPSTRAADRLWARIARARRLRLRVRWEDRFGGRRTGTGTGSVQVEEVGGRGAGSLVVTEEGVWEPEPARPVTFQGRYRWSRTPMGARLEHLRRGVDHPVYLTELCWDGGDRFSSRDPYLCGSDSYRARVEMTRWGVSLVWRVDGPSKSQLLETRYR